MKRQRGFTLIEVMFAAAAGGVVIAAATAFMLKGLGWYDELSAKVEINRHMRETYDLFAYGGKSAAVGNDGTHYFYSIRGMKQAPKNGMRTNTDALQYTSNKLTITPDLFSTVVVTCTAKAAPVPDCSGPGKTQNEGGWIGSDIKLTGGPQSTNNLTTEVAVVITDAGEAQRANAPDQFTNGFSAIFSLNRDENDP